MSQGCKFCHRFSRDLEKCGTQTSEKCRLPCPCCMLCHYGWCWDGRHRGTFYRHVFAEIESVEVLNWFKCEAVQGVVHLRPPRGQRNLHVFLAEESFLSSAEPPAPRNLPPTSSHLSFHLSLTLIVCFEPSLFPYCPNPGT